jgi:RNA polymerase sigma-70 factor (ECF subfamily)
MTTLNLGVAVLSQDLQVRERDRDAVDATLAASGDAHAFERLYRRHVARVHSLARRMLGEAEPEDVTQEVFVRAWRKLGTFRGESAFGTWLHRLALNVILSHRESRGIERQRVVDSDAPIEVEPARAVRPDLGVDFETALRRLPGGAREVFLLHDMEGYKHEEIAGLLDITVGTSKSQLHHARMALRRHLTHGTDN